MARIVTVYRDQPSEAERIHHRPMLLEMGMIRWFKISEAIARAGHEVTMAVPDEYILWEKSSKRSFCPGVSLTPLSRTEWTAYDAVKTLFHRGFKTLGAFGGDAHPFIISKLGSVVAPEDRSGIYFHGETREHLYGIQEQIHEKSRFVTLLSKPSLELWRSLFGSRNDLLLVPGAAEAVIPDPGPDPFPGSKHRRCLFAGNVYSRQTQREAHAALIGKLNSLGSMLQKKGIDLIFMGAGDAIGLDQNKVTILDPVEYDRCWEFLRHADAGLVIAAGPDRNVNESTKIYHYLRAGLPVVCESGFPNEGLITEAGFGFVVENGNLEGMVDRIAETVQSQNWNRARAERFILNNHTWDHRAREYDAILK